MEIESKLQSRFRCGKCNQRSANAKRIAATGTGISKLLDIQHNSFIALTCRNCGFTELYDPKVLGESKQLGTILDVLFER
jgi:predicted nucleic-acid-binding Zn-ribbon protein